MKLYSVYLRQYARNYSARLTFLLIGVMVAATFISYMGLLTDSIHATNWGRRAEKYGDFHGFALGISQKDAEIAKANKAIEASSQSEVIGTVTAGYEQVYVGVMDEQARGLSRLQLQQGSFPLVANEVAIEDVALAGLDIDRGIGDKIELEIVVTQGGTAKTQKRFFTLSGIFTNKPLRTLLESSYAGGGTGLEHLALPALLISPTEMAALAGEYDTTRNLVLKLKDKVMAMDALADMGLSVPVISNILYNPENFAQLKQYDATISADNYLLITSVILLAILGIVNSFYITVQERERQLGILRAIGATKGQLCGLVLGEAVLVSAVAIPVGLYLSTTALRFTMFFIESLSGQVQWVVVLPTRLLFAATVSLASVLFAAFLPAAMAMRISPVAVISGRASAIDAEVNSRGIRAGKAQSRPVTVLLAMRSLKRQKGRAALSVLVVLLAIFTTIFSFNYHRMLAVDRQNMQETNTSYAYRLRAAGEGRKLGVITPENGMNSEHIDALEQIAGVSGVSRYKQLLTSLCAIPVLELPQYMADMPGVPIDEANNAWLQLQLSQFEQGFQPVNFKVIGVDKKTLSELSAGKEVADSMGAVIYAPPRSPHYDRVSFQDLGLKEDDPLAIAYYGNKGEDSFESVKLSMIAVINSLPDPMAGEELFCGGVCAFIDEALFAHLTNESLYNDVYVYVDASGESSSLSLDERVRKAASFGRRLLVESRMAQTAEFQEESALLLLRLYTTTVVFVLLSVFILSNLIVSAVISRKREMAMLRAVGMTRAQLRAMLTIENTLLCITAGIGGVLLMLLFIVINTATNHSNVYQYSIRAQFPWIFSCLSVLFYLLVARLISSVAIDRVLPDSKSIIVSLQHVE